MNFASGMSTFGDLATRRRFLKVFGAALAACLGGVASLTPFRKAFAAPPTWSTVPNQIWTVGVPVNLDLSSYCNDPDADPLTFTLSQPLPPGLTLNGSIISGTPTATFAPATFVATADDRDTTAPAPPTDLRTR
ncbi:MAG TPA: hypothetical protein VFP58_13750 [Candidatus Eisenbacteria bacterium]|nr:hypothetical protein [Candidatus Eisenbacteria bacterium]